MAKDAQWIPAVIAGPLYVDFRTAPIFPPDCDYHTVLHPSAEKVSQCSGSSWAASRAVGGSAWKVALHWALTHARTSETVFVSRVPAPLSGAGDTRYQGRAFIDDGRWLRDMVDEQAKSIAPTMGLVLNEASKGALVDYAFHIVHPEQKLWPILSLSGGAASELTWQDVLEARNANLQRIGKRRQSLIFLGGVFRTAILPTLAAALTKSGHPLYHQTREILSAPGTRLVLDFGRTDLRNSQDLSLREDALTCVRSAHIVMTDYVTATELDLVSSRNFPKVHLVVRPHGALPGQWWLYRVGSRRDGGLERAPFEAPNVPTKNGRSTPRITRNLDGGDVPRPTRVAELTFKLLTHLMGPLSWQSHLEPREFREPEDITESPQFLDSLRGIKERIETDPSFAVLLMYGPTGSGKEVVARWLHRISRHRCGFQFVPVSCGRLRGDLVDSELFGHREGAFTNATADRNGAFHTANGGVLLVDDLDALPLQTQARLLRVIDDGVVYRVGSDDPEPVDVFLIATTNADPAALVRAGRLREDLYYRLRLGGLFCVPPLQERPFDTLRIGKAIWQRQNDIWSVRLAWPDELEAWLGKARLSGNCRTLREIIEHVHQHGRTRWRGAVVGDLPSDLDRLDDAVAPASQGQGLDAVVAQLQHINTTLGEFRSALPLTSHPRSVDSGGRRASAFFAEVLRLCQTRSLGSTTPIHARFSEFLGIWAEASAADPQSGATLARAEIMQCLGVPDKRQVQNLLAERSLSTCQPRVECQGTGRGAKWRLVRDPDEPADSRRSDTGS